MNCRSKWGMLCFLCGLFVLYTIDRAMLGLLAVPIQQETGLSDVKFGILSAAIFWTYAVCVPFSGLAGDRFDRAKLIGIASIAWSAMTFLAGFANGFWSLFLLVSVAIAAPQTLYGPSANALLAEQHKDTRTIALSCHQAAYYVGWFVSGENERKIRFTWTSALLLVTQITCIGKFFIAGSIVAIQYATIVKSRKVKGGNHAVSIQAGNL